MPGNAGGQSKVGDRVEVPATAEDHPDQMHRCLRGPHRRAHARGYLEPVHIGGVEVTHVTLHNQDEIDRKGVRIGDMALVERAGDVIPHVLQVIKERRRGSEWKYRLPKDCPVCGSPIVRIPGEVIARCANTTCPARLCEALIHFASTEAMDIRGLGVKLVEDLVARRLVKNVADIYALRWEDLKRVVSMGDKSARNIINSIEKSKSEPKLDRLIYGLGIPHVGRALATDLAAHFPSTDKLAEASERALRAAVFGVVISSTIRKWFASRANRELVTRLKRAGINPKLQRKGSRLEGKTLVFTGELAQMTRERAKEAVNREEEFPRAFRETAISWWSVLVPAGPKQKARVNTERKFSARMSF
jgi:DNA ligase (NAD+)